MKNPKLGDRDQDEGYSQMKKPKLGDRDRDEGYSQMKNSQEIETNTNAILR